MSVSVYSQPASMTISLSDPKEFNRELHKLWEVATRRAQARRMIKEIHSSLDRSESAVLSRSKAVQSVVGNALSMQQDLEETATLEFIHIDCQELVISHVEFGQEAVHPVSYSIQKSYTGVWNGRCAMITYSGSSFVIWIAPES